jgi:hypothetical protein
MDLSCIYWEKVDSLLPNESLTTAAIFNNLFGFHFMHEDHITKIERSRNNLRHSLPLSLIHPDLLLFTTPLEEVCSSISLQLRPIESISQSQCILIKSKSGLFPYKRLYQYWVSLSPFLPSPTLLLSSDMQSELISIPEKEFIFEVSFKPPDSLPSNPRKHPLQASPSLLKLQICKPNGHFTSIFSKPSHSLQHLHNQLVSLTGYPALLLIQKQSREKKRVLNNLSLPLSSIITSPNQNILFTEVPSPNLT